jgi:hypothetical protein
MSHIRACLSAFVLAGLVNAGGAFAQTPAAPSASSPAATTSEPSVITKIDNWTAEEWSAATTEWAKETTKWAACQQRATDQQLTGRTSWTFLYNCMI